mgnify:FL=1
MKYSEFETEVEKMGFYIGYSPLYLFVVDRYTERLASISKEFDMWLDTEYQEFPKLPQEQRAALFDLLYVISKTPLAEREEEKKYYLRLVTPPILKKQVTEYLRKSEYLEYYTTGLSKNTGDEKIKTIFTESEIAQMDITGFKKEPVE